MRPLLLYKSTAEKYLREVGSGTIGSGRSWAQSFSPSVDTEVNLSKESLPGQMGGSSTRTGDQLVSNPGQSSSLWQPLTPLTSLVLTLMSTLIRTPVPLLFFAVIHSTSRLSAAQWIELYRYSSVASVNVLIKQQNGGKKNVISVTLTVTRLLVTVGLV